MSGINKAILVGNMGRDIEVRKTQGGASVGNFSLATSKKVKGEERTVWHNIVVWDERKIEYIKTYCKTGTKLYVEGEISNRKWTDKEGNDRWTSEIVVGSFESRVEIMTNGRSEDDAPAKAEGESQAQKEPAAADMDDEVPF